MLALTQDRRNSRDADPAVLEYPGPRVLDGAYTYSSRQTVEIRIRPLRHEMRWLNERRHHTWPETSTVYEQTRCP